MSITVHTPTYSIIPSEVSTVGYLIPLHGGTLVACTGCSSHPSAQALTSDDLLPFSQHCHLCGCLMVDGIMVKDGVVQDKWDNPLPSDDRPTLVSIQTLVSIPTE